MRGGGDDAQVKPGVLGQPFPEVGMLVGRRTRRGTLTAALVLSGSQPTPRRLRSSPRCPTPTPHHGRGPRLPQRPRGAPDGPGTPPGGVRGASGVRTTEIVPRQFGDVVEPITDVGAAFVGVRRGDVGRRRRPQFVPGDQITMSARLLWPDACGLMCLARRCFCACASASTLREGCFRLVRRGRLRWHT